MISFKSAKFSKFDQISETHIVHMGGSSNWPLRKPRKSVVLADFHKFFKFRKFFEKKLKIFFCGFGNITPWLGLNFFAGLRSRRFRRDMSILSCHFHHFAWLISRLYRRTARFFPSGFSRSARELPVGEERIENFAIFASNGPRENRDFLALFVKKNNVNWFWSFRSAIGSYDPIQGSVERSLKSWRKRAISQPRRCIFRAQRWFQGILPWRLLLHSL